MPYVPEYKYSLVQGENNPKIDWFPVAASQTIVAGDFVQINSTSRLLEVAAASSTTIVGIANGNITTGASPTANDRVPVIGARFSVFRIPFTNAGTKKTFTQTDKYTTIFNLSNKTTLNPDNTTNGMLQVIDYDNTGLTADVVVTQTAQYLK